MDLGELQLPPLPRSGQCNCGGKLIRVDQPKPGVTWAVLCESCGKWLRWELERIDYDAIEVPPGRFDLTEDDFADLPILDMGAFESGQG